MCKYVCIDTSSLWHTYLCLYIQIENTEHNNKVERLNNRITELGKGKILLERKLKESNDERELLAVQNIELRASRHTVKGKLEEVKDVTEEHVSQMASVILSKSEEIFHLQEKLKEVEEQLEIIKIQVSVLCTAKENPSKVYNFGNVN